MIDLILPAALSAASDALVAAGRPVPDRVVICQGEAPWDACDILFGLIVRSYPSSTFPVEDVTQIACGPWPYAAQIGVGIVRCVSTPLDNGSPPSAAAVTADSLGLIEDVNAIAIALRSGAWWRPDLGFDVSSPSADWGIPSGGMAQGLVSQLVEFEWSPLGES